MKIFRICTTVAVCLFAAGCVARWELPENCNLDLEFHYEFDSPGEESFPEKVGSIAVYAFDQNTGLLADIIYIGKADIMRGHFEAELANGVYTFVCWATDGDGMIAGGYFPADMYNPAAHEYKDIEIGVTSDDEFRMMLACDPSPSGVGGELVPRSGNFDDLFFAIKRNVAISGSREILVPVNFICDTNLLKVRIGGLDNVTTRAIRAPDIFVTARQESYNYDNSSAAHARQVRFESPANYTAADTTAVDIKIQRMELATYKDRPVMLYLRDPDTGNNIIEPIDVVEKILSARDAAGNHPYRNQDAIDEQYDFEIAIELIESGVGGPSDLGVRVTVNEFEVVEPTVEI